MPSLGELQADLRRALIGDPAPDLEAVIVAGTLSVDARLAIYRHHVFTSLTAALGATFPVVRRLVDERFFAYAADRFIREHPPAGPCLFEYGAAFPTFLAHFAPCRDLVYLADVARLEWAMNVAAHADDAILLSPSTLGGLDPARVGDLRFGFDPSLTLLRSAWPIDRIWRANQGAPGSEPEVDLDAGGVHLEVARRADRVVLRELVEPAYAFRHALVDGAPLVTAAAAARAVDPAFDLAAALAVLFQDGVLVRFTLAPPAAP